MALPTISVTPGSGATVNTLPNAPTTTANSVSVALATDQAPVPISAASLPLPAGAATDGADATGVAPPAGGVGIRGWLSGIFNKLNTSIAVTGTFWPATQPVSLAAALPAGTNVIGGVNVNNTSVSFTNRSGFVSGAVAGASVTTVGTAGGFTVNDTLTMPTGTGIVAPAVLTVGNIQAIATAPAVASSGAGGGTGSVTLTGADGTGTKFVCTGTMTSGVLSGVSVPSNVGNYSVAPANANNTTGSGCAVVVSGAGAGTATGVQLYVKFTPAPGSLTVTTPGVYAPASMTGITALQGATAPASTSGGGSLVGLTVTLSSFLPLSTQAAPSNAARQYFAIRNESASQALGLSLTGAAVLSGAISGSPGTTVLAANGAGYEWSGGRVPSNPVAVIGVAAFQQFTAWEG